MPTDVDRGAYMKAIGVIVEPTQETGICGQVWNHQAFLQQELSNHMVLSDTIASDRYEPLLQYYTQHHYRTSVADNTPTKRHAMPDLALPSSLDHTVNYNLKHTLHTMKQPSEFSIDACTHFVNKFGPDVFVLWKAALLRKKMMLIHMPHMEIACHYGELGDVNDTGNALLSICVCCSVPCSFTRSSARQVSKVDTSHPAQIHHGCQWYTPTGKDALELCGM